MFKSNSMSVIKFLDYYKLFFFVLLALLTEINCFEINADENRGDSTWFDFEQMKFDLFTKPVEFKCETTSEKDLDCMLKLLEIGRGLQNTKNKDPLNPSWEFKILDAWGKIPSALADGNLYSLGGFSECFHIERDGVLYESKYCLGKLELKSNETTSAYRRSLNGNGFPLIVQPDVKSKKFDEVPFDLTPKIDFSTALTFGMCLPKNCSIEFLQNCIKIDGKISKKVSLKLRDDTCQYEEIPVDLRTLDWVTIGLLAIVLFSIAISTSYDIVCTIYNRKKIQVLLAFSFYSNGLKLLSYKKAKSPDMMHCLHGIRAISTAWIVLGHTFGMYAQLPLQNKIALPAFMSKYQNMIIVSAPIAVDTFFIMSGLLVSINLLKQFEKTKGKINIPLLYFHRYLRLTPLLGVSFLFTMSLLRFMGSGPIWHEMIGDISEQCERNWWSALLYIQNYVNPADLCFLHSWYLSVDMQLFILSPLIVYLIYRFKVKALLVMVLLVLGCVGCTVAVQVKYELKGLPHPGKFDISYIKTHIRYSPWLIGVIAGYIFFVTRNRAVRILRVFNLFAWTLSLATMAAVIFTYYPFSQIDSKNTPLEYGLYDALSRVGWAIALCYIIFACVKNSGGFVNCFLSHPLWQPISRLCYAIYLVHIPVILVTMFTIKSSVYFSEYVAFHMFLGNYIITLLISIIASLAFESPIVIIEKLLFTSKPKQQKNCKCKSKRDTDANKLPNDENDMTPTTN